MTDHYDGVVGQERAVAQLRAAAVAPVHAYLFVGPTGVGTRDAARAFAADLLDDDSGRALAERHPDLVVVEPADKGAAITTDALREVVRLAARPPSEAARKVLLLVDFHLVDYRYPTILKALEEPSPTTVFIVLAEQVPAELATIASRCVRIDFAPISESVLADVLVREGAAPEAAMTIAAAAGGRLDRARLLASDPAFLARREAWCSVPSKLDGSGATIAALADSLLASIEGVLDPVRERQAAEAAALEERVRDYGERPARLKELRERHGVEQRRLRQEELRFGFATLAAEYRDRLAASPPAADAGGYLDALDAIDRAGEALIRNPNETLLLQGLLVRLTDAASKVLR